jgi:hypothetical protein
VSYSEASGGLYYIGATNSATPDMVFSQVGGSERMRITDAGNVGIGTAGPGTKFDVYTTGHGIRQTDSGGGAQVEFYTNTTAGWVGTFSNHPLYFFTNNSSQQMVLTTGGALTVVGDITAFSSDERLKSKTGPITDALDKVCTLDTFTYTHNDLARSFGFTDKRQYVGISAQQVRKVQPEVVRIAPFDADGEGSKSGEDYITVQYERLVPLLIEALKEERKAREALGVSLRSLEERIKLLEQK